MVNKILEPVGIPFTESHFYKPPSTTHAVYNDAVERRGGDNINLVSQHDVEIELYSYEPDPETEKAIEDQFDALGIEYTKAPRYWLQTEQMFQTLYDFTYYEKEAKQ